MRSILKTKQTKNTPLKRDKKRFSSKGKNQEKFSLKRLLFGEEKPDLSELEAGSTTILDILSPTAIDTKSRDYILVDGVYHAYLYVAGYGYSTTVGSCWLAPLVVSAPTRFCSFLANRKCRKMAGSGVQPLNNYVMECRKYVLKCFRPS